MTSRTINPDDLAQTIKATEETADNLYPLRMLARLPRASAAGIACGTGALALIFVGYAGHGSKADQPDMVQLTLNTLSVSGFGNFANLELIPGEAAEPGHIRAEPPLSRLFPDTPLTARPIFKLR